MKNLKKFLGIVMVFVMVLAMLPIKAKAFQSNYDPYEAGKIQAFLNQLSSDGVKSNGLMLNASYNPDDITTWSGIMWTDTATRYVQSIDWTQKGLAGSLDVSNFLHLYSLNCRSNSITALNVSGASALVEMDCRWNLLTALDVSHNAGLFNLYCNGNQLTSLNVNGAAKLMELECAENKLTSLDISNSLKLLRLDCSMNQLTSLDVSKCNYISQLLCYSNQISSLNLTGTSLLYLLNCSYNQLTSMDISQSHCFTTLICSNNLITSINFGSNPELYYINCLDNRLRNVEIGIYYGYVELSARGDGFVGFKTEASGEYMHLDIEARPNTGATFNGWYYDGDAFISTEHELMISFSDQEVYDYEAYFSGISNTQYTVTFDPNGGTRTGGGELVQQVQLNGNAVLPVVERAGFVFIGWAGRYTEINEDEYPKAQWAPIPSYYPTITPPEPTIVPTLAPAIYHQVDFDPNGGTLTSGGPLHQGVPDGKSAIIPIVEREGYRFIGWDKPFDNVVSPIIVTAQWEEIAVTHQVTFDMNNGIQNGGGELVQTVSDGGAATAPIVSRVGYTFEGWDKAFDNVTEDITVTAQWKEEEAQPEEIPVEEVYAVIYDANGAQGDVPVDENDYQAGDTAVLADGLELTMEGYEFVGWSLEPDGEVIAEAEITISDNITLYAIWEAVESEPEIIEEPSPTPIPVVDEEGDIPKTGVPSGAYLGIIMLAFGAGIVGFEIIKKRRFKRS